MDILIANFDHTGFEKESDELCINCGARKDETVLPHDQSRCQIEARLLDEKVQKANTPDSILQLLYLLDRALLASAYIVEAKAIDVFTEYVQSIAQRIEGLATLPASRNASFARQLKKWASKIVAFLVALDELYEAFDKIETACAKKDLITPSEQTEGMDTLWYPTFAANRAEKHTQEAIGQAGKRGLDIQVRRQRLPRGALTIMDIWRQDVSTVIASMLQVNDSDEIREQDAGLLETFFLLERDEKTGRTRKLFQPQFMQRYKYKKLQPNFRRLPRSSTAFLMCKLLGMVGGSHGSHSFCLHLERYSSVPGLQALGQAACEEIEDMI